MADKNEEKVADITEQTDNEVETKPSSWRRQHDARETEREAIRNRHNNIKEYDGIVYKHPKPTPSPMDDQEKNIAIYTRVSTMSLNQTSSIENQELYYTDKVAKTPNWTLKEIYSDEGKSGTSTKHRNNFNRMMKDARNGKFDMIVCASVSRFSRNVSDCIDYVTELRTMRPNKPIGVFFETENIFTLNKEADQTLGFHALLADWESGNKSRRMILSYDQRIFTHQFPVSDMLGYRHTKEGDLIIEPEEAKTVRFVFLAYMAGHSSEEIAEMLTDKQRPTLKGRVDWNAQMVRNILDNERRWGDLEARKTVVLDYKKKKIVKNVDIREGAFVPNHHEGIVSPEMAKAAQLMAATRGKLDCVPDFYVIDEGTLKGFISVNPLWHGMDHDSLLSICSYVYTDDEMVELQHEANILFGKEHSKILSIGFGGYQIPYGIYMLNSTMPSMTLTKSKIMFSKACFSKMNEAATVEILYHPILKSIAIRPCDSDWPNAVKLIKKNKKLVLSFSARKFCEAIFDEMEWIREYKFKFRGITKVRDGSPILFFSLDEPRIYVGKKTCSQVNASDEERSTKRFIECTRDSGTAEKDFAIAYPEQWRQSGHGLSYLLRERRDKLTQDVKAADILYKGKKIVNPTIGVIPSRDEIADELDLLLASM